MARGFLAGAIWGLVVSGIGAGALSVAMGPPANRTEPPAPRIATDPVAEAVDSLGQRTEPAPAAPATQPEAVATAPATAAGEEAAEARETAATEGAAPPGETPAETPAETAPESTEVPPAAILAEEKGTRDAQPGNDSSEAISETAETPPPPARRPAGEQDVETSASGPALSAPSLAEGGAPDTSPLQRPESIPAPLAPDAPGSSDAARLAVGGEAPVQPGLPALPPEAPLAEAQPALSTDPAQPPQPAEDSGLAPEPGEGAVSEQAEMPVPETQRAADPEVPAAPRVTTRVPERPAELPQEDGPGIGTPATSLVDRGASEEGATGNGAGTETGPRLGTAPESRLPVITAEPAPEGPAPESAEPTPLQRYAAAFDIAPGEPAMSILLIDDGAGPLGPETVEAFPFPVSFAIAPNHPDPAAAAAAYRARGFEVLALADLPENATPSDTEVALEGALATVPEAVAVLEGADLALQHNRAVSEQAAQFLAASGHGLVMMPNGLNTAEALARRAGVPSLTVFRDFDGKGQDPRVMRRFLDQAAFRARQDENVVMLGRLRADTVSALLLWGLQDRASSVELVPVSALLLRQQGEG